MSDYKEGTREGDYLVRGTAWGGKVRVFAARTTELVGELQRRHGTYPTASAALGRTATIGAMMGMMLKGEEKLTLQVKGDGPIGQIVVDANAKGEVRGYVDNPEAHVPSNSLGKLDVAGVVGTTGFVHVTKDLGLKEPYRGSVPIVSGELGEDFTYYFASSEQTPSAVGVGVLVDVDGKVLHAGGFILQLLPGLTDEEIGRLETALGGLPHVTALLDQGETPEEILRWVVGDELTVHETMDVKFVCQCSPEKVEQTLISMGEAELRNLIEEEGSAEVVCHFCNEAYRFDKPHLERLLQEATAGKNG
ncbi:MULTISPECIES: Hsp33 family molecular chaperone HslO [unclassified Paenibacillus]|uniref:Hsp33 family molecular chaperone HslO n=1 Tax=unclassified Paenibacillus TaxID=185978 RepID=UPI00095683F5|nr:MULTISPECIES: Hsp33 family molecular chaperone HslO [unclassified Paenibacillus]ASS67723.1 Hsp33 family molecular chaperone HslO [Paenibacillus sp. RUD330]SIR67444.1 molecular chaperone Hsp33 [Paenibacillus sp. RU4X]SIR75228.1 molecular chaperone Hsp33 [Paenibacillus sp. RU4T]